jgi:hypothetical protein
MFYKITTFLLGTGGGGFWAVLVVLPLSHIASPKLLLFFWWDWGLNLGLCAYKASSFFRSSKF